MKTFKNSAGKPILLKMVKGIQENKQYLGDVDGLIGDGSDGLISGETKDLHNMHNSV